MLFHVEHPYGKLELVRVPGEFRGQSYRDCQSEGWCRKDYHSNQLVCLVSGGRVPGSRRRLRPARKLEQRAGVHPGFSDEKSVPCIARRAKHEGNSLEDSDRGT